MIVVADDLTGANDTGVQFVKKRQRTVVYLTTSGENFFHENKVSVINTDCRSLSPKEAYQRSRELARKLLATPQPFIYKKVDSTLRGNIGQEIDGLMDEIPFAYCAVAPAYPLNDRITIGGYHLVRGELLEDSELANDVKFPMTESHVPTLLTEQSSRKVGLVTIKDIRQGEIAERVKALKLQGIKVIVFDSATAKDLKTVTNFLWGEKDVLWAGSAALAQAFTDSRSTKTSEREIVSYDKKYVGSPTLTVAGSVSKITREQIAYQYKKGVQLISIHPLHLLNDEKEVMQIHFEEAKKILGNGKDLIITTSLSKDIEQEIELFKEKTGEDNFHLGNNIAFNLGSFSSRLINDVEMAGVILTGGDIAYQTCIQLGVNALEVVEEIEEGIPLSEVTNGAHAGMLIVTKAGAFGHEQSLWNAMNVVKHTGDRRSK